MEKENYSDAAEMFKSAADLAPEDPRPFYNIGLIYQKAVYDEKALEYFLKSLERDPKYLPSLRGAIVSGKRLDISDEPSLSRVRTALLIETDPQWRRIFQAEQFRIEGTMSRAKHGIGSAPTPAPAQAAPPDPTPPKPPEGGGAPPSGNGQSDQGQSDQGPTG
jgi:tetratricopeptide (TPR) repeat protein